MSVRAHVLLSTLVPGQEAAYEADHAVVPDDLLALLQDNGVRDWAIWRDGRALLHLVDVDDYADLGTAIAEEPANVRWQERMAAHVLGFEPVEAVPALAAPTLVWSLRRQVALGLAAAVDDGTEQP